MRRLALSRDEGRATLGALRAVAEAEPPVTPAELRWIEASALALGVPPPHDEPAWSPEEVGRVIVDPEARTQVLQLMMLTAMADEEISPAEAATVRRFAEAFRVDEPRVVSMQQVAEGKTTRAWIGLARSGSARKDVERILEREGFLGIWRVVGPLLGLRKDPEQARRFNDLGKLPAGTFGRAYWDFLVSNGLPFPGEVGAVPESGLWHDLSHVLGGYGVDPEGEVQVVSFIAGYRREDPFFWLFTIALQFHLGLRVSPYSQGGRGHFRPELVYPALERGMGMAADLSLGWDPWPHFARPLGDVRAELGIRLRSLASCRGDRRARGRGRARGMWVHRTRLPHLLPPSAYHDPAHHERELERIFRPGWRFVAAVDELPRSGAPVLRRVLDHVVELRRLGDTFAARAVHHAAPAWRGGAPCRVERAGALLFASLAPDGPSLRDSLDERTGALISRRFSRQHRLAVVRDLEHPCNWKIPLENVLESYHVPSLHQNFLARHPGLFQVFGGEPTASSGVAHELNERFSVYRDSLGARSGLYRGLIGRLNPGASTEYEHHHAFPNLVLAYTSIVSFLQVIEPTSPTTSRSTVRLFLATGGDPLGRLLRPALRGAAAVLIDMVLREDAAVYPDVQRGLTASPHPGVLGSREERIHAFHQFLLRTCAGNLSALPPLPAAR